MAKILNAVKAIGKVAKKSKKVPKKGNSFGAMDALFGGQMAYGYFQDKKQAKLARKEAKKDELRSILTQQQADLINKI